MTPYDGMYVGGGSRHAYWVIFSTRVSMSSLNVKLVANVIGYPFLP